VASERPLSCLDDPTHPHKHIEEQNVSNKPDKAVLDKNTHIDDQGFKPAALKVRRRSTGGGELVRLNSTARLSLN